jgi:hypothetical protein
MPRVKHSRLHDASHYGRQRAHIHRATPLTHQHTLSQHGNRTGFFRMSEQMLQRKAARDAIASATARRS